MHLPLLALTPRADCGKPFSHPGAASACKKITRSTACTDNTPRAATNAKIVKSFAESLPRYFLPKKKIL